jgi:flagellar biosynthesis protein FlhF
MQAALAQVKQELGAEAVILNTKTFFEKSLFGLGKKEVVEILASRDVNIADSPFSFPRQRAAYPRYGSARPPAASRMTRAEGIESYPDEILKELFSLKSQVELLTKEYARDPEYPALLEKYYRHLIDVGVSRELARKIIGGVHTNLNGAELESEVLVKKRISQEVAALAKFSGPIRSGNGKTRKIMMTGPTGVGKTTTIAKLAAHYSIKERRRVGLITADTYRIAAVDQLKVYAEIIGVSLDVVLTPKELRDAVRRRSDKELVFIDTAGRSQRNQTRLVELKNFLEAAEPDENHLLISATTDRNEIAHIIEKFNFSEVSNFIFSKVDESTKPGLILDTAAGSDKPISYLTTGQDVPDDIEVATESAMLALILRNSE